MVGNMPRVRSSGSPRWDAGNLWCQKDSCSPAGNDDAHLLNPETTWVWSFARKFEARHADTSPSCVSSRVHLVRVVPCGTSAITELGFGSEAACSASNIRPTV